MPLRSRSLPLEGSDTAAGGPTLKIQERFVSVQGEGALVGTPSTFLRTSGCNLRCAWCDTPLSSWQAQGERAALSALVEYCAGGPRHVVVTGGEPLLFSSIRPLIDTLRHRDHHVTIETAGTVRIQDLRCDLMSISPKLAHSTPATRDPAWRERHEARRWAPDVVRHLIADQIATGHEWQLKFVVRWQAPELLALDIAEIDAMLAELDPPSGHGALRGALHERDARARIFLMPETTQQDELPQAYAQLAPVLVERGFRLGERLHIAIFGHTPGT